MDYKNIKLYSTLDLADTATNSSFAGMAMALKMTNGSRCCYLKTVRLLTFGIVLVKMGWAMHHTFRLGFKIFPGGLTVVPGIPFCW